MLHVQWPSFYTGWKALPVIVLQNINDLYTDDKVIRHASYMREEKAANITKEKLQ